MSSAILLGAVSGIIGFLPLVVSIFLTKKLPRAGVGLNMAITLLCLAISFAFFLAVIFIYNDAHHDTIFAFVGSAAVSLSIVAIAFGIYSQIKHKK